VYQIQYNIRLLSRWQKCTNVRTWDEDKI